MTAEIKISLIAAAASNRVIGLNNAMPWHLSEDLKFFKAKTLGKPVIMGRKTYDSMGRPLPKRRNIVVSRNKALKIEGVDIVCSLDDALRLARQVCEDTGGNEIMVVGGEQIYRMAIEGADRVYLTDIDIEPEGDSFFPVLDLSVWRQVACDYPEKTEDICYRFLTFEKK